MKKTVTLMVMLLIATYTQAQNADTIPSLSDSLSAELSHLDVKQIEEIELITTPGAEYDATTGAVLKIIMRRRDEPFSCRL